jgi:nucleoside 2-deoxyribosyltransferase
MISRPILYLAGPLFNPGERAHNLSIRAAIEPWFAVYLPQVDGALLPDLLAMGHAPEEARRRIFRDDVAAIRRSDVLLIVLNGRGIDEGAAFELGIGWCLGKPCFGYKDDFRQLLPDGDNPMITGSLRNTFRSIEELSSWAAAYGSRKGCD